MLVRLEASLKRLPTQGSGASQEPTVSAATCPHSGGVSEKTEAATRKEGCAYQPGRHKTIMLQVMCVSTGEAEWVLTTYRLIRALNTASDTR